MKEQTLSSHYRLKRKLLRINPPVDAKDRLHVTLRFPFPTTTEIGEEVLLNFRDRLRQQFPKLLIVKMREISTDAKGQPNPYGLHFHLYILDYRDNKSASLRKFITEKWSKYVKNAGLGETNKYSVHFENIKIWKQDGKLSPQAAYIIKRRQKVSPDCLDSNMHWWSFHSPKGVNYLLPDTTQDDGIVLDAA